MAQLDVRTVALPCILCSSVLQYMRFAKKPMAAPLHKVSERWARRGVIVGLVVEILMLRLLPVSQAYPMSASCLVCLYFWKESKRSGCLPCVAALAAWLLPLLDPSAGVMPAAVDGERLLFLVLGPRTAMYVAVLLAAAAVLQFGGPFSSAMISCAPPAMNVGFSALLLKALVYALTLLLTEPGSLYCWAVLTICAGLVVVVLNAAAGPLRRALEANDNLTVLAVYGLMSSGAAMCTGCLIFGELDAYEDSRMIGFAIVTSIHCWGMFRMAFLDAEPKGGYSHVGEFDPTFAGMSSNRWGHGHNRSLEMSEMSRQHGGCNGEPGSPLLLFSSERAPRSVEEDAKVEEQLFARALAPEHLAPALVGAAEDTSWAAAWPESGVSAAPAWSSAAPVWSSAAPVWSPATGAANALTAAPPASLPGSVPAAMEPQFDADFEELMRRFDEDDKLIIEAPTAPTRSAFSPESSVLRPMSLASPPNVLVQLDAETMLDCGVHDDEDELLRNIEDIPGP